MKKILKKITLMMTAFAVLSVAAISMIGSPLVSAGADPYTQICAGGKEAVNGVCDDGDIDDVWKIAADVATWILTAVGVVCVIFIIFGGVRYATSGGDAEKVKKAKNTLLYALIGLAVALLANVIMSLVINTLNNTFN